MFKSAKNFKFSQYIKDFNANKPSEKCWLEFTFSFMVKKLHLRSCLLSKFSTFESICIHFNSTLKNFKIYFLMLKNRVDFFLTGNSLLTCMMVNKILISLSKWNSMSNTKTEEATNKWLNLYQIQSNLDFSTPDFSYTLDPGFKSLSCTLVRTHVTK